MNAYILLPQSNVQINNIPPRLMWNVVDNSWQSSASGYCGETSILSAGLLYGQYVPMYLVRQLLADYFVQLWGSDPKNASTAIQIMWSNYFGNGWSQSGSPQYDYPKSGNVPLSWFKARGQYYCQVLPQIWNNTKGADNSSFNPINTVLQNLHLSYEHFQDRNQNTIKNFIPWMKQHVVNGHPVVMGVQDFLAGSNDTDFDHIVVVIGWGSNNPLTQSQYYPDDEIVFSDHGLVVGGQQPHGGSIPYYFRFTMETQNGVTGTGGWLVDGGCPDPTNPAWNFVMDLGSLRRLTRLGQPSASGSRVSNTYQLALSPTKLKNGSSGNAGFAITGITDTVAKGVQVRIDTSAYYQVPVITTPQAQSGVQPACTQNITHNISVTGLDATKSYNLWMFQTPDTNSIRSLPTTGFNAYGKQNNLKPVVIQNQSTFSTQVTLNAAIGLFVRCVEQVVG